MREKGSGKYTDQEMQVAAASPSLQQETFSTSSSTTQQIYIQLTEIA